jgi:succinoglycan biosynthesis transport protein ExoP
MAIAMTGGGSSGFTPRDRLQKLVDLAGKTLRYWWLVAVFAVAGGGLSLAFALTRARVYQAEVVLGYQEKIQSTLLMNREEVVNRNIGDRYRELLLAHEQLMPIVGDPTLSPYVGVTDPQLAIDRLRQAVRFESRGGATFRIVYSDSDPDRARQIADRLAKLLQDKDEAMRNDTAQATVSFASSQKELESAELHKRERALAQFLATHQEFAADPNQQGEGASIRAIKNAKPVETGSVRLKALERQRQRIQARLDAPPDAPPIRVVAPPSEEKKASEQEVNEAQRELQAANRELADAANKFTEAHPNVIKAQGRVEAAQQRLRHAQAKVLPDVETVFAPASAADRSKLQKELSQLEGQITEEQRRTSKGGAAPTADAITNTIVQHETQYEDLRRNVNEQRDRVAALAGAVSRAETEANQELKQQGRLRVINAAEKPSRPTGPGKTIFLLAGMVLFLGLGFALAIGLAVIDDRIYRRYDIDQLGVAVLAVIPPKPRGKLHREVGQ